MLGTLSRWILSMYSVITCRSYSLHSPQLHTFNRAISRYILFLVCRAGDQVSQCHFSIVHALRLSLICCIEMNGSGIIWLVVSYSYRPPAPVKAPVQAPVQAPVHGGHYLEVWVIFI